jgi:hypothetical protein
MQTFFIVLKELWVFVVEELFTTADFKSETVLTLPPLATPTLLEQNTKPPHSFAKEVILLPSKEIMGNEGSVAFIKNKEARVFQRPVFSYDGVIQKIPYATKVSIIGYEGRFARITLGEGSGFVLKDSLTEHEAEVLPELLPAEIYSANHPDTHILRKYINDEFFTTELFLPLQSIEYVTFVLWRMGRKISWPEVRPRLAGNWQNILKGQLGIHIGVMPKTGSIVEYSKVDGSGWVGYTKAVHVDESIVIQGVGRLIEGEYREEHITKAEWQEWRPIWITVS